MLLYHRSSLTFFRTNSYIPEPHKIQLLVSKTCWLKSRCHWWFVFSPKIGLPVHKVGCLCSEKLCASFEQKHQCQSHGYQEIDVNAISDNFWVIIETWCLWFESQDATFSLFSLPKELVWCRMPAVIITSSGTAVANLLPAIVESSQSRIPLIILSADRPVELRETSANQTIDQVTHLIPVFCILDLQASISKIWFSEKPKYRMCGENIMISVWILKAWMEQKVRTEIKGWRKFDLPKALNWETQKCFRAKKA